MKQLLIIIGLFAVISSCDHKEEVKDPPLVDNHFRAIPMPKTLVTGNPYPTDSTLINSWVAQSTGVNNLETNRDIIDHGWAIWSALTEMTDQSNNRQRLRRFETWYTPQDIIDAYTRRKKNPAAKLQHVKRNTGSLTIPHQHRLLPPADPSDASVVGFVKYDPSDAEHIFDNNLFYQSTLNGMLQPNQIANIPNFPNSGVALKPVFYPLSKKDPTTGLYRLPVWPGDEGNPNRIWGHALWRNYVFVTLDGETNEADSIFSVKDFVHFQMDSAQAASVGGNAGDYALLQGMHVTTRETTRWTWQTFWWSQNDDTPYSPSSSTIAALRNDKNLDRAANHYAMAVAYNMVQPAQTYNGGTGENAASLYAYNPYLEAGFGKNVFSQANDTVQQYYSPDYQKVGDQLNEYGMQSNCMSCHGQARYIPSLAPPSVDSSDWELYLTDQYFELDAPYFKNTVKLDFTWSIRGNLIPLPDKPTK